MKKILLFVGLWLSVFQLSAQHETLFSKSRVIGGFGSPIIEFSNIKGDFTTSMGGGGAVVIDNFFIGAYGVGSLEHLQYNIDRNDFRMELVHGGLWLGYTPNSFRIFHPYTSAKIGWGFADIRDSPFGISAEGDSVFVFTPEVGLELNLTRFFRLAGSIGYRMVSDVDQLEGYSNKDFSSLSGQITLRFGWFGKGNANRTNTDFDN